MNVIGSLCSKKRDVSNLRVVMKHFLDEVAFGLGPEF